MIVGKFEGIQTSQSSHMPRFKSMKNFFVIVLRLLRILSLFLKNTYGLFTQNHEKYEEIMFFKPLIFQYFLEKTEKAT